MPIDYKFEDDSSHSKCRRIKVTIDNGKDVNCFYLHALYSNIPMDSQRPKNPRDVIFKFEWSPYPSEGMALARETADAFLEEMPTAKNKTYKSIHIVSKKVRIAS